MSMIVSLRCYHCGILPALADIKPLSRWHYRGDEDDADIIDFELEERVGNSGFWSSAGDPIACKNCYAKSMFDLWDEEWIICKSRTHLQLRMTNWLQTRIHNFPISCYQIEEEFLQEFYSEVAPHAAIDPILRLARYLRHALVTIGAVRFKTKSLGDCWKVPTNHIRPPAPKWACEAENGNQINIRISTENQKIYVPDLVKLLEFDTRIQDAFRARAARHVGKKMWAEDFSLFIRSGEFDYARAMVATALVEAGAKRAYNRQHIRSYKPRLPPRVWAEKDDKQLLHMYRRDYKLNKIQKTLSVDRAFIYRQLLRLEEPLRTQS